MANIFRQARFLTSAAQKNQFVADTGSEIAFAGRSNAGKSSAINTLCQNRKLARISKTPGRTRLINFFELGSSDHRLVDLPGYGFAKVPDKVRQGWQNLMESYLQSRTSLHGLVIISDIRHPLKNSDWQMLDWCHHYLLPAHIVLTKADKLKKGPCSSALLAVEKQLETEGIVATTQTFSALKNQGVEELEDQLMKWLTEK